MQNKVKASENSCLHNFHIVFITRLYQDNKVLLDMVLYLGQGQLDMVLYLGQGQLDMVLYLGQGQLDMVLYLRQGQLMKVNGLI